MHYWWFHQYHAIPVLLSIASHDQKIHVAHYFKFLDLRDEVVSLVMSLASHDTNASAKSHATPHFNCLELRNAVVPSTMPLISCDADGSTNGMTWEKESCCTSFWSFWPKECNGAIEKTIGIRWHQCEWHHMKKESCCNSFQLPWP